MLSEPAPTAARTAQFRSDVGTFGVESSSCIVYLQDVLKIAHEKIQCAGDWRSIVGGTGGDGMPLALNLEKWGWIGIYYNPDTRNPFDRKPTDPGDTNWTNHTWSYLKAKTRAAYDKAKVHALVVNYRPTITFEDGTDVFDLRSVATKENRTDTVTTRDNSLIGELNSVPFGILNARGGTHTAIFMSGAVWEVHWAESQRSVDVYEATNFERDWAWLDGIIHVPRGLWT